MNFTTIETLYSLFLQNPSVQTDTRKLAKGDLYFALKGENFNGNHFAEIAIESGAAYAIIDEKEYCINDKCILVKDVLEALQELSALHRQKSKAIILAITGTNGKTTTKELIASVLSQSFKIIFTQGNLNNHIGVPLTLLNIKEDTEIAIIEMGANHVGEIENYCNWAKPDYGVITNIGKAHLEGFGSIEGVKKAKGELYESIAKNGKMIFQYVDTPYLKDITPKGLDTYYYGYSKGNVIGKATSETMTLDVYLESPSNLSGKYSTNLVGDFNLPNVLCAISIGQYFKMEASKILKGITDYIPNNHRSQLIKMQHNTVILDAYNANPSSLHLAIENLAQLSATNKWALLGAMKELGENSTEEHAKIIQLLKDKNIHQVYLVGKEYENSNNPFQVFATSEELKTHLQSCPIQDATILIKGSRGSKMEIILDGLS